jgi:hypothetical protein
MGLSSQNIDKNFNSLSLCEFRNRIKREFKKHIECFWCLDLRSININKFVETKSRLVTVVVYSLSYFFNFANCIHLLIDGFFSIKMGV